MPETLKLPTLTRELVLDREALQADVTRAAAAGDDRIPMSLSSEFPVERGGFFEEPWVEVLDHSPEAVDLSRAAGGLPLLLDHDPTRQIGVLEDVHVGADRKLRGLARFSRSVGAQEVRQDVLDGIRTRTSIGYRVRELEQESRAAKGELATYRATKWELYENSIVSIPADPTVGVGRSADEAAHPVVVRSLDPVPADEARSVPVPENDTAAPQAAPAATVSDRGAEIVHLCALAGQAERAVEFVNSAKSLAEIRGELMAARKPASSAPVVPLTPHVEEYEKGRKFSIATAIRAVKTGNWKDAGYERAVSENEAKRLGQNASANQIFVPTIERLSEQEIEKRAVHVAGTANVGGNTVFTEFGGFIDILRNRMATARLGATILPGLVGNVAMPRQTGASTAYWMSENSGSDATESNITFDQVTLSPKTLMALSKVSNQLLAQSAINVEQKIRDDLARVLALEVDRAAIHGSGSAGQPTGLYGISGVNSVAFGGTVTYAKLVEMVSAIAADNADYGAIKFALTPETAAKGLQVSRFSSTDTPVFTGTFAEGSMIAYGAVVSNQLSKVLGAGTNEHAILAGVWPSLLIGEWGAMSLTVDPYTLAGQDLVRVIPRLFVDVDVDHAEAFCKGTGLIP